MKRKAGFYWCKWQGVWEVCEWNNNEWFIPGLDPDMLITDSEFQVIDERRILNPNE